MTDIDYSPKPPFAHSSGPKDARIAIVGEAWGKEEAKVGQPFIGYSGQELTRMLNDAGIKRWDCFLTNVFAFQPPDNNLDVLCVNRAQALAENNGTYPYAHIKQGKYVRPLYFPEIERLWQELEIVRPNVVIAMGNPALWALCGVARIGAMRGTVTGDQRSKGLKVLPTYHPAAVLRNWAWRPIVVMDLLKAKRELEFPEIRRPERWIITDPSPYDIEAWIGKNEDMPYMAVDIETERRQISMIGFATAANNALVIPFSDWRKPDRSYWETKEQELKAWTYVQTILWSRAIKIFQNGLFDLQYILRMGLTVTHCNEDTMLMHHSEFPELQKGLGFLGSVYTNEASWKLMRGKDEELKRDE